MLALLSGSLEAVRDSPLETGDKGMEISGGSIPSGEVEENPSSPMLGDRVFTLGRLTGPGKGESLRNSPEERFLRGRGGTT